MNNDKRHYINLFHEDLCFNSTRVNLGRALDDRKYN